MENVARFEGQRRSRFGRGTILLVALAVVVVVWALNVKDWHQLWTIVSAPDNIPIAALLIVVPFFTCLGLRQSRDNDELIEQLEADPQLAKTHHRKTLPWRPGWARELHVWPYLVRIEFLAAVIVTVILFVWSILINAPLEEPANPNLTMNPSKAPWYFLGLQEMLVYFDPWIAGVVMPGLLIVGLMVFPYVDSNPLRHGPRPSRSSSPLFAGLRPWRTPPGQFQSKLLERTSLLQYMTFQFFAISVLFLFPIKLLLRLLFTIKYIWVTPWFNV